MQVWRESVREKWAAIRNSSKFRSLLTFLIFVGIAALFWIILTLNDSVQSSFMVNVRIIDKPDSITFISEVPKHINIDVKDKGSSLMRSVWLKKPTVNLSFKKLADDGQFICSRADMLSALKSTLGSGATILSMSIDSLRLIYTDRPGKQVPVQVSVDASAKAGFVVYGQPCSDPPRVTVYGPREILDTINRVFTKAYIEKDLNSSKIFNSELKPVKGVRMIPSSVKVTINIEPLVVKESIIQVTPRNVPNGESLLLFPSTARVSYYVPMPEFSDEDIPVKIIADYNDVSMHMGERLPLRIEIDNKSKVVRPKLHADSVEYTLVR